MVILPCRCLVFKEIVARFDGDRLSSDGGLLVLREIEKRLKVADRLAACIDDPRDPGGTVHTVADVIRFPLLMIAAGYADGNDATSLRTDPLFKLALERLPSGRNLCSAVDHLAAGEPAREANAAASCPGAGRALLRVVPPGAAADHPRYRRYLRCGPWWPAAAAVQRPLRRYGFQPIVVFDQDGRFVTALLRRAKRPKGGEIRAFLRRLIRAIRGNWPNVEILVRADSHYACPEVLDWCAANGLDYILGLAPTRTLKRHVTGIEASSTARFRADPSAGKVRRFKEFYDGHRNWSVSGALAARCLGCWLADDGASWSGGTCGSLVK